MKDKQLIRQILNELIDLKSKGSKDFSNVNNLTSQLVESKTRRILNLNELKDLNFDDGEPDKEEHGDDPAKKNQQGEDHDDESGKPDLDDDGVPDDEEEMDADEEIRGDNDVGEDLDQELDFDSEDTEDINNLDDLVDMLKQAIGGGTDEVDDLDGDGEYDSLDAEESGQDDPEDLNLGDEDKV